MYIHSQMKPEIFLNIMLHAIEIAERMSTFSCPRERAQSYLYNDLRPLLPKHHDHDIPL